VPNAPAQQNPLQPTYVNPTYSNYNVSPQSALQQFQSADALQDAQANNNLANLAASQGISGGDLTAAQGALQGQLAASQAPSLAGLITNAQGMGLGQAEFNAGTANAANTYNASAKTSAGDQLAQYLQQNYGMDFGAMQNLIDMGFSGSQGLNLASLGANNQDVGAMGQYENQGTANNWASFLSALGLFGGGGGGGTYITPSPGLGEGGTWPTGDW
jgi:hypothetical protein